MTDDGGSTPMPVVIRPATREDAAALAELLNAIIARGGTTALEEPYSADGLAYAYLVGPDVVCCFVAVDADTGALEGFQTLGRLPSLPAGWGDIGTFARVGGTQRGIGTALFPATRQEARQQGLQWINATIRADNTGGLAFYGRLGFEDYRVSPNISLKDGTPVDRVHKRYPLAGGA
jgi:L-amino acid N-acyltransferase YncA